MGGELPHGVVGVRQRAPRIAMFPPVRSTCHAVDMLARRGRRLRRWEALVTLPPPSWCGSALERLRYLRAIIIGKAGSRRSLSVNSKNKRVQRGLLQAFVSDVWFVSAHTKTFTFKIHSLETQGSWKSNSNEL